MPYLIRLTIFIVAIFVLSNCSKKKDDTPSTPDKTQEHSTAIIGSWKLTAQVSDIAADWDNDGDIEQDVYAALTDCNRQYILKFAANKSGSVKWNCSLSPKFFNWVLEEQGYLIKWTMEGGAGPVKEKLISVNGTTLVTQTRTQPPGGPIYTFTNTYTKQ